MKEYTIIKEKVKCLSTSIIVNLASFADDYTNDYGINIF
jgi:hypothetical protein